VKRIELWAGLVALNAKVRLVSEFGTSRSSRCKFFVTPAERPSAGDRVLPNDTDGDHCAARGHQGGATYEVRQKEALDCLWHSLGSVKMKGSTVSSARIVLRSRGSYTMGCGKSQQALTGKAVTPETAEEWRRPRWPMLLH